MALIGAVALVGDIVLLPGVPGSEGLSLRRQLARLGDRKLLLALAVALLGFGGQILAYTYVTPFLEDVSGFGSGAISLLLLVFGIAAAAGNFIAGPVTDRWPRHALLGGLGILAAALFAMTFAGQTKVGAVIVLVLWGAAAFGVAPVFQGFVYRSAPDIPEVAGALAASAFNFGIAGGAALGGQIVAGYSVRDVTWVGGAVVTAALAVAASTGPARRPGTAVRRPSVSEVARSGEKVPHGRR